MNVDEISFTSFNLLNLNEPGLPMYRDAAGWTEREAKSKVAWTASMLERAEADVFGFQEFWHPGPLSRALDAAGLGESHVVLGPPGHAGQGIACAAAVRRDLLVGEPEWITRFPERFHLASQGDDDQTAAISVRIDAFSRPVMHLQVRPREDARAIHVFIAHLKSKRPTEIRGEPWFEDDAHRPHAGALGAALSTIRRTAEATALRLILTDLMKGTDAPVVVLGDLNDGPDTSTIDILTEQPTFLRPLSTGGRDNALYSVQGLQQTQSQRDVYYTYIHQGVHGSLDHILVSRELYDLSRTRVWRFDGLDIFNDHLNDDGAEKARGANDHGVVRARFRHKPA